MPDLRNSNYKTEEDALWGKEVFNDGESNRTLNINSQMVSDGIIHVIDAGYGSSHDTDSFIIAICDDCISENKEDGTLLYYGNYMTPGHTFVKEEVDKSKMLYRRRKNLDGLV